jgi:PqqD family protein of HPr-rel-A system
MKSNGPSLKWYVPDNNPILLEEWDNEAVVYNPNSGETHQLDRLSVDVLKLIKTQPVSLDTLTESIRTLYQVEDNYGLEPQLEGLILQFDTLGLIEPLAE